MDDFYVIFFEYCNIYSEIVFIFVENRINTIKFI